MIAFLTYMMLGALLMALTFKVDKYKENLPVWYANYTVQCLAKGEEFVSRDRFDKIAFICIFLMFLFAWPATLFMAIKKAFNK